MTSIRVFRRNRITGERSPWVIVLDHELTIVREYEPETEPSGSSGGATEQPQATATAVSTGYADDSGWLHGGTPGPVSLAAAAVSAGYADVARWATEEVVENPIPGTDALRREFFDARRSLIKFHEDNGTVCPSCELGNLLRQYKEKLIDAGHLE